MPEVWLLPTDKESRLLARKTRLVSARLLRTPYIAFLATLPFSRARGFASIGEIYSAAEPPGQARTMSHMLARCSDGAAVFVTLSRREKTRMCTTKTSCIDRTDTVLLHRGCHGYLDIIRRIIFIFVEINKRFKDHCNPSS